MPADALLRLIITGDAAGALTALAAAKAGVSGLSKESAAAMAAMSTVGKDLAYMGAAAALGLGLAVRSAAQFEASLTAVQQAGRYTTQEMDRLKQSILGWHIAATNEDVAAALKGAAQAGFNAADAWTIAQTGIRATVALGGDALRNTNSLATAMAIYGAKANEAAHYGDVLTRAVEHSKLSFGDMAGFLPRAAQAAFTLGLSWEQLGGIMEAVSHESGNSRQMVMGMAGLLNGLADKGYTAQIRMQGLIPVLEGIAASTGMSHEALKKLLGSDVAINQFIQLAKNGFADLKKSMTDMTGAAGELDRALQLKQNDLSTQLVELRKNAQSVAIEIGDDLLPQIKGLVSWLGQVKVSPEEAAALAHFGEVLVGLGAAGAALHGVAVLTGDLVKLKAAMTAIGALAGGGALIGTIVSAGALADLVLLTMDLEKYLALRAKVADLEAQTTRQETDQYAGLAASVGGALETMRAHWQDPALSHAINGVEAAIQKVMGATTDAARSEAYAELSGKYADLVTAAEAYKAGHASATAGVNRDLDATGAKLAVLDKSFGEATTAAKSIGQASSVWSAMADEIGRVANRLGGIPALAYAAASALANVVRAGAAAARSAIQGYQGVGGGGGEIRAMSEAMRQSLGLRLENLTPEEISTIRGAYAAAGPVESQIGALQKQIGTGTATEDQQRQLDLLNQQHDALVAIIKEMYVEQALREGFVDRATAEMEAETALQIMTAAQVKTQDVILGLRQQGELAAESTREQTELEAYEGERLRETFRQVNEEKASELEMEQAIAKVFRETLQRRQQAEQQQAARRAVAPPRPYPVGGERIGVEQITAGPGTLYQTIPPEAPTAKVVASGGWGLLEADHAIAMIEAHLKGAAKEGGDAWQQMSERMGETFTRCLSDALVQGKLDFGSLMKSIESMVVEEALKQTVQPWISKELSGVVGGALGPTGGMTGTAGSGHALGGLVGLALGDIFMRGHFDDPIADLAASRSGRDFAGHFLEGASEGARGSRGDSGRPGAQSVTNVFNQLTTVSPASPEAIAHAVTRRAVRARW